MDRIDGAVPALTYLTLHDADRFSGLARAWKSFDWSAMNRLREKQLICDPVSKAKSVVLTGEGGPVWAPIGGPDCSPFDARRALEHALGIDLTRTHRPRKRARLHQGALNIFMPF